MFVCAKQRRDTGVARGVIGSQPAMTILQRHTPHDNSNNLNSIETLLSPSKLHHTPIAIQIFSLLHQISNVTFSSQFLTHWQRQPHKHIPKSQLLVPMRHTVQKHCPRCSNCPPWSPPFFTRRMNDGIANRSFERAGSQRQ